MFNNYFALFTFMIFQAGFSNNNIVVLKVVHVPEEPDECYDHQMNACSLQYYNILRFLTIFRFFSAL